MSEESPQDLDKLFQQEPEQYPFDYNEASWQEMEKLLDEDDRRRFLWWWFFGIGALLLIGSIFFFEKNKTELADGNLDLDKMEVIENQNKTQQPDLNSNFENQNLTSKESSQSPALNSIIISNKKETNNPNPISNKNSQQYNYKKQKGDLSLPFNNLGLQEGGMKNTIVSDSIFGKTNDSRIDFLPKEIAIKNEETDSVNVLLRVEEVDPIASLQFLIPQNESFFKIPSVEKKKEKDSPELPPKNQNKILFGVLLGAESTGASFNNLSELNWKIGAQLEYRFLKRYTASIGANFIRKRYGATGDDYSPDPASGSWLYDIPPSTVGAVCDILEVPLNIGFFQKGNNENGFYSKLGLSSFIMLEEHYWYYYENPLPGQIRYWGGYNENKHWFGIGEVYVGYQRIVSPLTSLQVEPYFQIPLAGVGNGNVKLWSIGVNLRVNFLAN